jgi:hypothetical protein
MSSSARLWIRIGILVLKMLSAHRLLAGEEAVRSFPTQKCSFKLPGPDWAWIDKQLPNGLFMAANSKGFIITLSISVAPVPIRVNEKFAEDVEKTMYQPGQIEKRGGRFITFRGLPCYQAEGIVADGRTTATRLFSANGYVYHLSLLGSKEPVEKDPGFERFMEGFEFTAPPEQPAQGSPSGESRTQTDSVTNISEWMGRIAGYCILLAIVLGLTRWSIRKWKRGKSKSIRAE